jgi:hypothetical protein
LRGEVVIVDNEIFLLQLLQKYNTLLTVFDGSNPVWQGNIYEFHSQL